VRVAIFVAVVAAHLALLWLVTSLHRWVLLPAEDEAAITPIFLPPLPPEPAAAAPRLSAESQAAPALQENPTPQANSTLQANTALQANMPPQASPELGPPQPSELTSGAPDWRAAAAATAQTSAQHIVEAEDDAARKAAALTSRFKPLPGSRVPGPAFGWDYAHTHRITPLEGGGFVVALNDRCSIAILPLPMIGCSVGRKSPANGDLFKYMHPPVKFGDWDWRVQDP
jgi:hypothetical protein